MAAAISQGAYNPRLIGNNHSLSDLPPTACHISHMLARQSQSDRPAPRESQNSSSSRPKTTRLRFNREWTIWQKKSKSLWKRLRKLVMMLFVCRRLRLTRSVTFKAGSWKRKISRKSYRNVLTLPRIPGRPNSQISWNVLMSKWLHLNKNVSWSENARSK